MKMKKTIAALLAVLLLAGMLAGCGGDSASSTAPASSAAEVSSTVSEPAVDSEAEEDAAPVTTADGNPSVQHSSITLDCTSINVNPLAIQSAIAETYELYEMLFQVEDGLGSEIVPVLADGTRGEFGGYDHEAGSNTYTFYIYDYIYDHAGNHLTASDVVFSFEKTQEYGQTSGWSMIEGWEAVDDTTIEMTCSRELTSKGELENIVLRCFMFTEAAYNASPSQFASDACGTGPYKLDKLVEGASVTCVKNEDYWQTNADLLQRCQWANVDSFTMMKVSEATQRITGLETGALDMCTSVPTDYIAQFMDGGKSDADFDLSIPPANMIYYLEPNCDSASLCSDVNLRNAVLYAVDNEALAEARGRVSNTPLITMGTTVFADYNSDWENWDNYNTATGEAALEKAKEYLAQSSYNGEELVLMAESGLSDTAVIIQSMLQAAGINVKLSLLENTSVRTLISEPGEWDLYINATASSDYITSLWSHVMNKDSFSHGMTEGFVDSSEYQELLQAAMSVNATQDDVDAFWQATIDGAYAKGLVCGVSRIAYPNAVISGDNGLWMNDKSRLQPGAFIYIS